MGREITGICGALGDKRNTGEKRYFLRQLTIHSTHFNQVDHSGFVGQMAACSGSAGSSLMKSDTEQMQSLPVPSIYKAPHYLNERKWLLGQGVEYAWEKAWEQMNGLMG